MMDKKDSRPPSQNRRWSINSDSSDMSDISTQSLPQYSSYRAFSSKGSINTMSGIPTPSRLKQPSKIGRPSSATPRRNGAQSSQDGSITPSYSRESSFSKFGIPIFRREASMPVKREISRPEIKRETSSSLLREKKFMTPSRTVKQDPLTTPAKREIPPASIRREGSETRLRRPSFGSANQNVGSTAVSGVSNSGLQLADRVVIAVSNKRGVIQFIGETKFAKGEWAGVVLDDASGKNDGSVAGIRYFQCQTNHGVFVRVEKLTKIGDPSDVGFRSNLSATPSASSRPPLPSQAQSNLKVDDSVSILGPGNRKGILQFIGPTGFAKGIWCGVELATAEGKNDGAVAGTRYFQCEPKHGLFAPVHKVSKITDPSPSSVLKKKLDSSPPTKEELEVADITKTLDDLTAQLSTEDARSSSPDVEYDSSISRDKISSLETELRAKDDIVQEMQRERESQRIQYAESSQKFAETEEQITSLRNSYDEILRESKTGSNNLQSLLATVEKDRDLLKSQLEEEKKRSEDLQFQLEEQVLLGPDAPKPVLEVDTELISKLKEELATKSIEISRLQDSINNIQKSVVSSNENQTKLTETLQTKESEIFVLEEQLLLTKSEKEDLDCLTKDLKQRCTDLSDKESAHLKAITDAGLKIRELESALVSSLQDKGAAELAWEEQKTNDIKDKDKQIVTLEEDLASKVALLSDLQYQSSKFQDEINSMLEAKAMLNKEFYEKKVEITALQDTCNQNAKEISDLNAKVTIQEDRNKRLQEDKLKVDADLDKLMKSSGDSSNQTKYLTDELQSKTREVNELQQSLSVSVAEITQLKNDVKTTQDQYATEKQQLLKNHAEDMEVLQSKIQTLEKDVIRITTAEKALHEQNQTLQQEMDSCKRQVEHLSKDMESKTADSRSNESQLQLKLDAMETSRHETETEYKNQLSDISSKLESKSKDSAEKSEKLKELNEKHENLSSDFTNITHQHNQLKKDNEKLLETQNQLAQEREGIILKSQSSSKEHDAMAEELVALKKRNASLDDQISKLSAENGQLISETGSNKKLNEQLSLSVVDLEKANTSKKELETRLESLNAQLNETQSNQSNLSRENGELLTKYKKANEECSSLLQRFQTEQSSSKQNIETITQSRDLLQSSLKAKDTELEGMRKKVIELQQEVTTAKVAKPVTASVGSVSSVGNAEIAAVREEKEMKEREIDFLNSVIVDLRKKNIELESKIGLIEAGGMEFMDNGPLDISSMSDLHLHSDIKPRLFCDICDEFDLHDTEDCPTQETSEDMGTQHHGTKASSRPYCTICEAFGHSTEECDDEMTF